MPRGIAPPCRGSQLMRPSRRRGASRRQRAVDTFVFLLSIFVLAIFVGYYVVWWVTPALHTPLMSVTNAISSVIVVGALLAVGVEALGGVLAGPLGAALGFVALILASVNIFGGFLVTQRMLGDVSEEKVQGSATDDERHIVALLYLVAGVLFILALRGLSSPGDRAGAATCSA